jgi:hypothetical protein
MVDLLNLPSIAVNGPLTPGFFDDFTEYTSTQRWTTVGDGPTVTVDDARCGILKCTTLAVDNDEIYIVSTAEIFKVLAGKPIQVETRIQYSEANVNDANICFGVAQEAGANLLVDAGAGLATTLDGALFYKVDGETRWRVGSSNATAQTLTETQTTAGGSSYQTLQIIINPVSSVTAKVTFHIDTAGERDFDQCRRYGANVREPDIEHDLTITGLLEMHVVVGVKAGDTNAETLNVDYINAWQKR